MTKRPVGLIRYLVSCSHSRQHRLDDLFDDGFDEAGLHLVATVALVGLCWVDSTTVSMLCGLPST